MRRRVVTGTPGAGRTTLADALAARGHAVVRELATDVMATYGSGAQPWGTSSPLDERVVLVESLIGPAPGPG